ncbi:MAG TPA: fused MFS/spermidine synthase [Actinomycetes bacterium]|nr:fused MFS/spermidine synthase [Actinomycetes bacterium]
MAVQTAPARPPSPAATPLRRPILALFVASGAAGLVYQVVWSRELVLVFGNTTQAVATIVTAFLACLGLGSLVGGRLADRVSRPLRRYGALELGVAAFGLVLPFVFGRLGDAYRGLYGQLVEAPAALTMVRFALAFAAVAPATFLMGMTLPVLTRHLVRSLDETGARIGELYAANTLGAMVGTLLAGFVLIELLGLRLTSYVAVGLNVLAGLGALLLGRMETPWSARPERAMPTGAAAAAAPPARRRRRRRIVLGATFVSGFVALGLEVLWTRMLAEGTGSNIYIFSGILAVYLLGIALGSAVYRRRSRPDRDRVGALGLCLAGVGLVALLTVVIGSGVAGTHPFLLEAVVVLLPATFLMGYGFPLAGRLVTRSADEAGGSVGLLYAANTAGSILGSFSAAFLLAGSIGTNASVLLLGAVNLLVGAALVATEPAWRRRAQRLAGVGLAGAAALALVASALDLPVTRTATENELRATGDAITHAEDELATVDTAAGKGYSRRLLIGGVGVTSLTVDTKLMAYLPKALRPQARDFLVVALGMGATYRSGLELGLRTDVVELSPTVPSRMPVFFADADRYLRHPNGRVIVSDGRNYIRLSSKRYDMIAVDPAPPIESAGSVVLYTREFLTEAKARLNPGGVFLLWIPYALPLDDFKAHVRTVDRVFAHSRVLLSPGRHGAYLLGSDAPMEFADADVARVLGSESALRDLGDVPDFPRTDAAGWVRAVRRADWLSDAEVTAFTGPGPDITDDRPRSEYFLWRRAFLDDKAYVHEEDLRAARPGA